MNRRTFLKTTAAASAAALFRPLDADAALPPAKITRIRLYEAPTVMPLQIPLLQSNMIVTIETDANITGIGEGGTRDTIEPCAGRLIGKNPFHIDACGRTCIAPSTIHPAANASTRSAHWTWRCGI
jgi:galactonate dehydratase